MGVAARATAGRRGPVGLLPSGAATTSPYSRGLLRSRAVAVCAASTPPTSPFADRREPERKGGVLAERFHRHIFVEESAQPVNTDVEN